MAIVPIIIVVGILILMYASLWKIFTKAGKPGWAAIIPIYNAMVMAEIAEKPSWWGLLTLIPYVGMIWGIWILNRMIKRFGKGVGYTIATLFFGIITLPMLAFGDATYTPDGGNPNAGNSEALDSVITD